MNELIGSTSNGFDYTAQYDAAVSDSIIWAATFRKAGIYRGMRHGRVFEISKLSSPDLQLAIRDHIEEIWVNEH